jgi:pimeloyl-ACP methyl ester carboxylesterase
MPYYVWGDGPPLVFIHGLCDSGLSFLQPIARLSRWFRCVAYDLPSGNGDGARLGRCTHADLVADLWALLDHLRLERTYLFAASFGSTVALSALRQRPERLPRAVLQGGLAHRPLRLPERLLAQVARFLPGRAARLPLREMILRDLEAFAFARRGPEVWRWFLARSGRIPIRAFAHQALLLHRVDLRRQLADIRQPILLLNGDRDRVVPPQHAELLMRELPNVGRVVLENCGHAPSCTHPEVVAEVVRTFLTPPTQAPGSGTCAASASVA